MRFGKTALALAAVTGLSTLAQADTVYNLTGSQDYLHTQRGFNYNYLGDDVTIAAAPFGFGYELDTVTATFGTSRIEDGNGGYKYNSGAANNYTPNLEMSVFAIDPVTRLPVGPAIATATRNDVLFVPQDVPGDFDVPTATSQAVTFTFAPGTILPTDFAFAYRDLGGVAADGDNTDELNFFGIIGTFANAPASTGSTVYGSLLHGNGTPPGWVFDGQPATSDQNIPNGFNWSSDNNALGSVTATLVTVPVPEPASLGLLALGGVAMLKRRRTA